MAQRIRARILSLFFTATVLLLVGIAGGIAWLENHLVDRHSDQEVNHALAMFHREVQQGAQAVDLMLQSMAHDPALIEPFVRRDREKLFIAAAQDFELARRSLHHCRITFLDAEGKVLLRMNQPEHHGDPIDIPGPIDPRHPDHMRWAVREDPAGELMVHVIQPWILNNRISGYIAMAYGTDTAIQAIQQDSQIGIAILLPKAYVDPVAWRQRVDEHEIQASWNGLPGMVVASPSHLPEPVRQAISKGLMDEGDKVSYTIGPRHGVAQLVGLDDQHADHPGWLLVTVDTTDLVHRARQTVGTLTGMCLAITAIIGVIFFVMLGRIERNLVRSERKLAEENQRRQANLRFLQTLIDTIPSPIFYKDRQGRYLGCNDAFEQMTGKARHELIGKSVFDLWPEDQARIFHEMDRPLLEAVAVQRYESQITGSDGQPRDVLFCKGTFCDASDQVAGLVGIALDVTDQKRLEAQLKASEREKTAILDSLSENVIFQDTDHRVLWVNQAACDAAGLGAEQIVGRHCYEIWQDRSSPCEVCPVRQAGQSGCPAGGQVEIHQARQWEINAAPVRDDDGQLIGVVETSLDVTERIDAARLMAYRLEIESMVRDVAERFVAVDTDSMDRAIDQTLEQIGQFTGVDRAYVFDFTPDLKSMSNTHEWCAGSIKPQIHNLQNVPSNQLPYWMQRLVRGESVHIPSIADLPDSRRAEREILAPQGIQSLLVMPMICQGRLRGYIGFDAVRQRREWSEHDINLLQTVSSIITGAQARVNTALALRASENHYRLLFEESNDGIFIVRDHVFVDCNRRAEQMLGRPREQIIGHRPDAFSPPTQADGNSSEQAATEYNETALSQEPQTFEWQLRRADGDLFDCEVSLTPLDIDGQPHLQAIVRDITERKQAQRKLAESEQRYALAAAGANEGLWDANLVTRHIYLSPRFKQLLGYGEDELNIETIEQRFKLTHPNDRLQLQADMQLHLEGRTTHFLNEHRIRMRDGSYRWFMCRGLAVRDEQGRPVRIVGSTADIHDRRMMEERLKHDAQHDGLTGLPNRERFSNRLTRALGRLGKDENAQFAVFFLDFDRFKVVNDSLGHHVGDQFLREIAIRLQRLAEAWTDNGPAEDQPMVARFGGDEFALLVHGNLTERQIQTLADEIQQCLSEPMQLNQHEVLSTVSIGVTTGQVGYHKADDVLRDADTAMYRAKARGKACHVLFDQQMHDEARLALRLENDLRRAVDRNQLALFYQPVIDLGRGCLAGFEALLRWHHPEVGMVGPDQFIPIAEETGLIVPMGHWILDAAAGQLAQWNSDSAIPVPLYVTVNIAKRQLLDPSFVDGLQAAIQTHRIDPKQLKIEVTESVFVEDVETVARTMAHLKDIGYELLMDDFGTGHSSLSRLHDFPVDTVKIDRAFVQSMSTNRNFAAIIHAIVTLAHNLNMGVIAEGVETQDQLAQLLALDVNAAQGYFFARPMPADQVWQFIKENGRFDSAASDQPSPARS